MVLGIFLFSSVAVAAPTTQVHTDEQFTQESNVYTQNELTEIREIHAKAIKEDFVILNPDGTITLNTDAATLEVDVNIFTEYAQSIENLNDLIKLGVVSISNEFEVTAKTQDEVTKIIVERDTQLLKSGIYSGNRFDPQPNNLIVQSSPDVPTLYAFSIATTNKRTLTDYYNTQLIYNPYGALSATTGFFVAKVQPKGPWDYKSVPGYTPYYKEWWAVQRYGTSVKTSEWFGNYNYGFTGKVIFPLSVLLDAGDAVSILTGHGFDDAQDKADITQGYNENPS